ncbi:hypothetical protein HanIR_Chr04g0169981 [Helianthus annuus]|nr:hypothetical protein HanIR_Chr04g0169981 [Helianthus annuus]
MVGVLRNLGNDHEEKKPKRVSKKKVTVAEGVAHKMLEVTGAASDVVSRKGGKPLVNVAASAWSSGSIGSKEQHSGATPTSTPTDEAEADPSNVELIRKNTSKRPREEIKSEAAPGAKKVATGKPAIGKKGTLRTLYTDVSTEGPGTTYDNCYTSKGCVYCWRKSCWGQETL